MRPWVLDTVSSVVGIVGCGRRIVQIRCHQTYQHHPRHARRPGVATGFPRRGDPHGSGIDHRAALHRLQRAEMGRRQEQPGELVSKRSGGSWQIAVRRCGTCRDMACLRSLCERCPRVEYSRAEMSVPLLRMPKLICGGLCTHVRARESAHVSTTPCAGSHRRGASPPIRRTRST